MKIQKLKIIIRRKWNSACIYLPLRPRNFCFGWIILQFISALLMVPVKFPLLGDGQGGRRSSVGKVANTQFGRCWWVRFPGAHFFFSAGKYLQKGDVDHVPRVWFIKQTTNPRSNAQSPFWPIKIPHKKDANRRWILQQISEWPTFAPPKPYNSVQTQSKEMNLMSKIEQKLATKKPKPVRFGQF